MNKALFLEDPEKKCTPSDLKDADGNAYNMVSYCLDEKTAAFQYFAS